MGDLKDSRLIYLKGALFFCIGATSVGLILLEAGTPRIAVLLALAIWSFCRLYYFMFYVIEKYVDPQYKFAGIISFVQYLISRKKA